MAVISTSELWTLEKHRNELSDALHEAMHIGEIWKNVELFVYIKGYGVKHGTHSDIVGVGVDISALKLYLCHHIQVYRTHGSMFC